MPTTDTLRKKLAVPYEKRWTKWITAVVALGLILVASWLFLLHYFFPHWFEVRLTGPNLVGRTQPLVDSVAAKIAGHRRLFVEHDGKAYILFDLNGDGVLDGDTDPCFNAAYREFARENHYYGTIHELDYFHSAPTNQWGELLDSFGFTLRVKVFKKPPGSIPFGIFSVGPDGKPGTEDDICSWGHMEE